jgi:hypothetical protein
LKPSYIRPKAPTDGILEKRGGPVELVVFYLNEAGNRGDLSHTLRIFF